MARKNLLKDLMESAENPTPSPAPSDKPKPATPRYKKGAIGAVSQSLADLKSRSVSEIDVSLIDMAGNVDRLEHNDADHEALMRSISEYGQQVPVLLRHHPENPDRFQVVYGRRRLRALKDLGLAAKALIRDLDDRELIIAQGQENTARKDLTFIERANFARQMLDAGYDRKVIGDALHVDKTVISRMLTVADLIPVELIEAIGPAPSVGRDRWLALSNLLTTSQTSPEDAVGMIRPEEASDQRFKFLLEQIEAKAHAKAPKKKKTPTAHPLKDASGDEFGRVTWSGGKMVVTIAEDADGFDEWLLQHLTDIHRDWKTETGE